MNEKLIFISTGEASGDMIGGGLIEELRLQGYQGNIFGLGSKRMKDAGAVLLHDIKDWAALGIYQSLKVVPKILRQYNKTKKWIKKNKPDVVIAVDFGYVNVRLLRYAKFIGCKTLYFMPPGAWRKSKQGSDLKEVSDVIATPFEWSEKILKQMGATVFWVGHPIKQLARKFETENRMFFVIMPGSRKHEYQSNLPVMAKAMNLLLEKEQELKTDRLNFVMLASSTANVHELQKLWSQFSKVQISIQQVPSFQFLKNGVVSLVCSGTATLESAVCKTPMVVIYRGDKIMELEYRIRKPKFDYVALPSILLGKKVVPELIQWDATPERIAEEIGKLLSDSPERRLQMQDFEELEKVLGPDDSLTRTANIALKLIN